MVSRGGQHPPSFVADPPPLCSSKSDKYNDYDKVPYIVPPTPCPHGKLVCYSLAPRPS